MAIASEKHKAWRIAQRQNQCTEQINLDRLIAQRSQARRDKNWQLADKLRDEIEKRSGKRLVDRADGSALV